MEIPAQFFVPLVLIIAISLISSFVALWVSIFKDDARENRLRKLEDEVMFLRGQVDKLKAEGLLKDEKIASQAKQITAQAEQIAVMQEQIEDKERQIVELRRQIRPGTL